MSSIDNLVVRCQQGELAAFTELFRQHEARFYRLAVAILQQEQDAEDAVQDAFIRIFEQIQRYEGKSSFNTWATAVVVNVCRDKMRRQKVRRVLTLEWLGNRPSEHNVVDEVTRRETAVTLWTHIGNLDEKHRLPLILHYHERLSCEEVAQILGLPTSTVYSRLNTARQRLRVLLQSENSTEQLV
jgi:RNA polymerase sigma-70 factor (ECF subfamily)